ncbi:MAG: ATP-binding protein [Gammaproteobacteria bacterium]|nr:ATP-binding protein [Gammaproteobacteria bacterium]
MVEFVGRRREIGLLTRAFESPRAEFIPIYGRRRVGKSELILRFMAGKPGVYYLGKQSPTDLQVREFLAEAATALAMPLVADLRIDNWRQALLAVVEQWSAAHPGAKLILALDEFQWIAAASPELLSELQNCWDRHWKPAGNVVLVVCGSYLGFMEREVLGKTSPLFGRRTAQIHLRPFGYQEAADFHPRWSVADRARAYFLVGGIPQYLLGLDDTRSIDTNIREHMLDEFVPLFHEPTFLLREELREVAPYHAILFAIASGARTVRTIADAAALPERNLHYYIQQLVSLGYIERSYPCDGRRRNPRQLRLRIVDPLLKFWFRFVFPNTSILRSAGARQAFAERIAPSLEAWFGSCFEQLCREALPLIYLDEGVHAGFEVGEFWSKETQIDIVGVRDDNWTDLGECKWGRFGSTRALVGELEGKVARYPNTRGATLGRRYFVRRKPARASAPGWYSLDDLYALPLGGGQDVT